MQVPRETAENTVSHRHPPKPLPQTKFQNPATIHNTIFEQQHKVIKYLETAPEKAEIRCRFWKKYKLTGNRLVSDGLSSVHLHHRAVLEQLNPVHTDNSQSYIG